MYTIPSRTLARERIEPARSHGSAGYKVKNPNRLPLRVLDRQQEVLVVRRKLPHWSQPGVLTFITLRTWDSIPKEVLGQFIADRRRWLLSHGIEPSADWHGQLERLAVDLREEFRNSFSERWHENLDACYGECVLRRPEFAKIVSDSLLHFDGDRYGMTDFIVMPNHIHLLAAFAEEETMLLQCESWKRFTATKINRALKRTGRFWQQDGFDHLVRSVEQFEYLRRYILDNPRRAKLGFDEYLHYSKDLEGCRG